MKGSLERRAQMVRSRAAVRAWEYRQRNHAKGAWYRLRRLLAGANHAFVLAEPAARELMAEGYEPSPEGSLIEPQKIILRVPAARLEAVADKRPLAVRLSAELLAAPCVALVPFTPAELRRALRS